MKSSRKNIQDFIRNKIKNNQKITKARSLMQNEYKPIMDFENVKKLNNI